MSTVSTASTVISLWTPLKHISKTKFHVVNSVTSVNSSKSLNSFKAYFKNKISVLSTMSTASYSKRLEKKMWFLLIFDIISVNSVNSINSNKYLIIFEAYFKNKISMLSPVSTASTAVSLSTSLKHISKIRCTRKYPLRGYILGVLTHTTALDRIWGGDGTLTMWF